MNTDVKRNDNGDDVDDYLAPFISAARGDLPEASLAAAVARVRDIIPKSRTIAAAGFGWMRLGAVATALVLVLAIGQYILPGNSGSAFAEVQRWFSSFRTVHVQTTISTAKSPIVDLDVWALADGTVRIEQAGIVHVLDPAERAMFTLLPDKQYFELPLADAKFPPQALDWFEDIRKFKGEADRLDEVREVEGIRAVGYRLQNDGTDITLWVDPGSHRPLLLEGALPGGLNMESTLHFDVDVEPSLFEIPSDFRRIDEPE